MPFALVSRARNRIITTSTIDPSAAVSVSELSAPKRLAITLDPGLVLERLILRRVSGLQRKRGHDWLRSLLVQGFLTEGRWLRSGEPGSGDERVHVTPAVPVTPYGRWLERSQANGKTEEVRPRSVEVPPPSPRTSAKPFAHLRGVIG